LKQKGRQTDSLVYTQKKRKCEEENVERSTVIYSLCCMVPNPQWYILENYKATASFAISVNSLFVLLSLFMFLFCCFVLFVLLFLFLLLLLELLIGVNSLFVLLLSLFMILFLLLLLELLIGVNSVFVLLLSLFFFYCCCFCFCFCCWNCKLIHFHRFLPFECVASIKDYRFLSSLRSY